MSLPSFGLVSSSPVSDPASTSGAGAGDTTSWPAAVDDDTEQTVVAFWVPVWK